MPGFYCWLYNTSYFYHNSFKAYFIRISDLIILPRFFVYFVYRGDRATALRMLSSNFLDKPLNAPEAVLLEKLRYYFLQTNLQHCMHLCTMYSSTPIIVHFI
jgi:hypothetical protein